MPGKEYILAIHLVNYVPRLSLNLITQDGALTIFPILSGPALRRIVNDYLDISRIYQIVSITVCAISIAAFLVAGFSESRETNLRLIAFCPTCLPG
jgi:hypothetical protein